jgi:hypothetical protein
MDSDYSLILADFGMEGRNLILFRALGIMINLEFLYSNATNIRFVCFHSHLTALLFGLIHI